MRRRSATWLGLGIAITATGGLAVYLSTVGIDEADKIASVLSLFVGLIGLALAVFGMIQGDDSQRTMKLQDVVSQSVTMRIEGNGPSTQDATRVHTSGPISMTSESPRR